MKGEEKLSTQYNDAVKQIKTAILQSQAKALKGVNQEQLALYYGIMGSVGLYRRTPVLVSGGKMRLIQLAVNFQQKFQVLGDSHLATCVI